MPTVEATVETVEAANQIMSFGYWFAGGHATFGSLAAQVGLAAINLTLLLWMTKWLYSILIELNRKKGGLK